MEFWRLGLFALCYFCGLNSGKMLHGLVELCTFARHFQN